MEPTNQLPWIIFELKQQLFAVSTEMVTGISQLPPITKVPNAPPMFLGVTSSRGSVVPTLDLKMLLNIGDGKAETDAARKLIAQKKEGTEEYIKELERCIRNKDEFSLSNTKEFFGGSFSRELKNGSSAVAKLLAEVESLETEMTEKASAAKNDGAKLREAQSCGKRLIRAIEEAGAKLNDASYRMVIFLSDVPGSVEPCLCFVVDGVKAVDKLEMVEERSANKCLFMSGYVCGVAHNEKLKGEILIADDKEIVKMVNVYNESVEEKNKTKK
ncbi:MAG: chemotaxis protein CheW [Bacteroides sp.]|nr:chemotaxis protein CheW [Bacteroides sp.]